MIITFSTTPARNVDAVLEINHATIQQGSVPMAVMRTGRQINAMVTIRSVNDGAMPYMY